MQDDGNVALDFALFAGLESELRKNFLQWRDGQRIFGVKFADDALASRFSQRLTSVVNGIGKDDGAGTLTGTEKKTGRIGVGAAVAPRENVSLLTPRQVWKTRRMCHSFSALIQICFFSSSKLRENYFNGLNQWRCRKVILVVFVGLLEMIYCLNKWLVMTGNVWLM